MGVKLNTTVDTESGDIFPEYGGKLEVLNGIPYSIQATWDVTDIHAKDKMGIRDRFAVNKMGKNVYINVGKASPKSLKVYNVRGRLCWEPKISKTNGLYTWQPQGAGMYLIRLESGKDILTKRITIVK